jgi:hypothetical protein
MDDAQSNGTAGFASEYVGGIVVGVNRMKLRSDKSGSKDRAPSRGSRRSPNRRRRRISASSGDSDGRTDAGDDVSSSTALGNQPGVTEEANNADNHPEESIILCQACCKIVPPTSDHVIIQPCMHTLCNLCIIKSQVGRGWRPHKCPAKGCDCESETLEYVSSGGGIEEICKPTIDFRPVPALYLKEQHKDEIMAHPNNKGIAISCAKVEMNKDGKLVSSTTTIAFIIRQNSDDTVDVLDIEKAVKDIGKVFTYMHYPLAKSSVSNMRSSDIPVLSPREYLDMRCRSPRMLDMALFALSTGKKELEETKYLIENSPSHQKQFLAATISSDIMLRNLRKGPDIFQAMVGDLVERQQVTRDFRDLLSVFNLAPSREFTLRARAELVLTQLQEGVNVSARDLVLLFFDNVGFKILGRQASYDQWIVINIVVIPEADLKAAGFYNDEGSDNQRISREPDFYWDEEINDITAGGAIDLAEKIVGIQEIDFERLSQCVLENIRYVLVHHNELRLDHRDHDRKVPRFDRVVSSETYDKSYDMMVNRHCNDTGVDTAQTTSHHSAVIPRTLIPDDVENELGGNNLTQSVADAGVVETVAGGKNKYVMNNTKMQVEHLDLSKTTTVEGIAEYMVRGNTKQKAKWEEVKANYPESAELPLAEIMIGCGCDGQPAEALRKIIEEDAKSSDRKYPSTFFFSFGGFHTVMKGLNASGEYFQVLLRDLWSSYRDSAEKLNWAIFPSDPRQREEEYSYHLLANYAVAAENLRNSLGRDVSAVEVNEFMIERAKQYPICALALLEIRIGSVMKLLRNSEKLGPRGCVSTFLTAIRLLMPLFAVTHKTDYMRLCQNLLRWYYCASPANKKIYSDFIFTQLTSNGKPIFHDNSVENAVRDLRAVNGHVYRQGMGLAMEVAAAAIPLSDGTNSATRDLRNRNLGSFSRSRTHDTITSTDCKCPYFKIADKYNIMQIWSVGVAPVIQGQRKGTEVVCNDTILEVPGGGEIHSMILSAYTELGRERTRSHFMEYFIYNEDGEKTMSDKTVDLTKIDFTAEVGKLKRDQQITIQTSTTAKELDANCFTKAMLMEHIKAMRDAENNKSESERVNISEPVPKKSANKTRVIEYLVKWRSEVFKKNPTMKDTLEEEVKRNFADKCRSTPESRDELLKDTIFWLSDSVRQNERYSAVINSH